MPCLFCEIARHAIPAAIVFEDDNSLAFLDHRPLFHGHCLLIPKDHAETLADLPEEAVGPLFRNAQLLAQAVEQGMDAGGSFVAVNNRISQSVPHLHIHIVPRRKGDGLKGFFWPRTKYADDETLDAVRKRVADALAALIH